MKRYITNNIKEFWQDKIVLLMGPREVGKATLSKKMISSFAYYNYDIKKDKKFFIDENWDRDKELVIFDELHKMKKWKLWPRGIYDDGGLEK